MSLDVPQLKTASTYVNNLLLARGLLRNGKAVDFAALGAADSRNSSKSAERAAEVINLVHDLILRRDRETDQWSSLSETLADLRSTTSMQSAQIDRLKGQNSDLTRQLSTSQASAKSALTALSVAESSSKAFREEVGRVKATLAQVRTQCANDVRKRDVQLQKLKTHLSASQRGSNGRLIPPNCTINGGSSSENRSAHSAMGSLVSGGGSNGTARGHLEPPPSLEDAEYNLRQETTEFLTQLSQNLSGENDSLLDLVRNTVTTLRELQNLPPSGLGKLEDRSNDEAENAGDDMVFVIPSTYQALHADLEYVLGNLRAILTNASFVPIDEVYAREEEICRLRDGWERMESRWRDAVEMMKGWQERMLNGGGTVNLEELKRGLGLGEGLQHVTDIPASPAQSNDASQLEEAEDPELEDPELPEEEPSFVGEEKQLQFTRPNGDDHLFEEEEHSSSLIAPSPVSAALKETTNNVNILPPSGNAAANKEIESQQENDASSDLPRTSEHVTTNRASTDLEPKEANGDMNKISSKKTAISGSAPKSRSKLAGVTGTGPRVQSVTRKASAEKSQKPIVGRHAATNSVSKARSGSHSTPARKQISQSKPPSMNDDGNDNEEPLSVEQKLKYAESEARRISGSAVSDTLNPSANQNQNQSLEAPQTDASVAEEVKDELEFIPNDQHPSSSPKQTTAEAPADVEEDSANASNPRPEALSPSRSSRPAARTAATAATQTKSKARVTSATTSTVASRAAAATAAASARGGNATTTRIPTKPAAPEHATATRRAPSGVATAKRNTHAPGAQSLVEESLGRSRRKRKSTLSPEELEELMGLRRQAEDTVDMDAQDPAVAGNGDEVAPALG